MSWTRAIVVGMLVVLVAFVALVYIPGLLLAGQVDVLFKWKLDVLSGLDRHGRVAVTTAWFTIAVVALAWGLRKLQGHHVV